MQKNPRQLRHTHGSGQPIYPLRPKLNIISNLHNLLQHYAV
jgi:hypothetical protein